MVIVSFSNQCKRLRFHVNSQPIAAGNGPAPPWPRPSPTVGFPIGRAASGAVAAQVLAAWIRKRNRHSAKLGIKLTEAPWDGAALARRVARWKKRPQVLFPQLAWNKLKTPVTLARVTAGDRVGYQGSNLKL